MKKYVKIFVLLLCIMLFSSCTDKNEQNTPDASVQTSDISTNDLTVKKIDVNTVVDSFIEQLPENGVYSLESSDKTVVVFIGSEGQEYDINIENKNSTIIFSYTTNTVENSSAIYKEAYLVENFDDDTVIKLYKDNKETAFSNVIVTDDAILK